MQNSRIAACLENYIVMGVVLGEKENKVKRFTYPASAHVMSSELFLI